MLHRWILWMNRRNNTYIKEFNPQKGIRLARNKIQTKKFLTQRWIPVPQTLAHIKTRQDRLQFDFSTISATTFIIKPNKWSKGTGIFVIKEFRKRLSTKNTTHQKRGFLQSLMYYATKYTWNSIFDSGYEFLIGDKRIDEISLKEKGVGIFDGRYASNNKTDTILLEDRLIPGAGFTEFCEYGLADVRVIIFNLVPIIAMLRMPTKESWWKANLAQWGVWLWLDIVTGKITSLYYNWQSYTTEFPSEWKHFKWKKIPYWQEIIQYSANAQYFVNIWYLWMDWVVTNKWPKILEINARSWLEIQNITGKSLLTMMRKIEDIEVTTPNKWIEISNSLFSDERINEIKDQHIIYLSQTGKLLYSKENKKRGLPVTITVWIDKTKNYTSEKVLKRIMGATNISVDLWHHDTILRNIDLTVSKEVQWNKIILWQQSLTNYYIKPIHKSRVSTRLLRPECFVSDELVSLKLLDEKISTINKQLNLAQILKPTNYLDEFDKFVSNNGDYNPQFTYNFPKYKELNNLQDQLKELDTKYRVKEYFDSTFAQVFFNKIEELQLKINLIKAYKKQDFWLIHKYNIELFGDFDPWLLWLTREKLSTGINFSADELWPILRGNDIVTYIKNYIAKQKLEGVRVRIDDDSLSRISVWFWKFATIKIKSTATFREYKLVSKLIHEINVHVMRYLNGKKTGRNIFSTGTAWYLETEEWLAVYLANRKLQEYVPWYDGIAKYKNYDRCYQSMNLDFSELAQYIIDMKTSISKRKNIAINYKSIFNTILKFKKWQKNTAIKHTGIVFWKNLVYLNGYKKIENKIKEEWEQFKKSLQHGKYSIDDLQYIK